MWAKRADHPDGQEGLKVFSEKRKPEFNVKGILWDQNTL
jgi:hypothetical protein